MSGSFTPRGAPLPARLRSQLLQLYSRLDRDVQSLGVGCWVHGACCDFERQDHRLYASSLEVALTLELQPEPSGGSSALCPFWKELRCTAREHRPLGCRTYFCDPRFREALETLYERYYGELRGLAERYAVPWYYGPFVQAVRNSETPVRPEAAGPPEDSN